MRHNNANQRGCGGHGGGRCGQGQGQGQGCGKRQGDRQGRCCSRRGQPGNGRALPAEQPNGAE